MLLKTVFMIFTAVLLSPTLSAAEERRSEDLNSYFQPPLLPAEAAPRLPTDLREDPGFVDFLYSIQDRRGEEALEQLWARSPNENPVGLYRRVQNSIEEIQPDLKRLAAIQAEIRAGRIGVQGTELFHSWAMGLGGVTGFEFVIGKRATGTREDAYLAVRVASSNDEHQKDRYNGAGIGAYFGLGLRNWRTTDSSARHADTSGAPHERSGFFFATEKSHHETMQGGHSTAGIGIGGIYLRTRESSAASIRLPLIGPLLSLFSQLDAILVQLDFLQYQIIQALLRNDFVAFDRLAKLLNERIEHLSIVTRKRFQGGEPQPIELGSGHPLASTQNLLFSGATFVESRNLAQLGLSSCLYHLWGALAR